jgi:secreted trypsin-like serine protease
MGLKRAALAGGFLVALVGATATTVVAANASDDPITPRIVDGRNVSSAPWAAQLAVGSSGICSGTIIAPHWVLTAAHCIEDDMNPATYTTFVGNVNRGAGQQTKVKSLHTQHDIALVELDRDIATTYITLASANPAVNTEVDIFGWGHTCETCPASDVLKTAKMTVNSVGTGTGAMVELRQNGDGYALSGDSGGPAMQNGVQFGVLCCGNTGPGGAGFESYSSVPNNLGWVKATTGVGGGNPPPSPSGNLALNKATKSKQASCAADEGPDKAVNGTASGNSDKWCSGVAGAKSLEADLGANRSIKRFTIKHAGAGGESTSRNTSNFILEVSTGGGIWTTAATITGNTASTTNHAVSATARWIRITTNDPVARIYEFEAYSN